MAHSDTRTIFYGSVSGMAAKLVEYPFDTVKVRLQAQPADRPWYRGPMHCFTSTLQHEGLRGFYRGVASPLLGAMVENSVLFYTYGWFQGLLGDILGGPRLSAGSTSGLLTKRDATVTMEERLPMSQLVIAGALAGVCAGFVLTPIELVKCRIQIRHAGLVPQATATAATTTAAVAGSTVRGSHNGGGTLSTTLRIIKYEGIGALFQGFTPTMIREAGGGIAWFGTYEL
ncbi:mitochondrial ornithine carrier protein, partial [Tieghemiomyces parasiticus]